MQLNIEKIKDKIRKLLAIAEDDKVIDGEINAAMKLAEKAMNEYHLSVADIEAQEVNSNNNTVSYGSVSSPGQYNEKITAWEQTLAMAIQKLIGTIGCYTGRVEVKSAFGNKSNRGIIFYGNSEEAQLGNELFVEWSHVIATIAQGKYSSTFSGKGRSYAEGFSMALYEKSIAIEKQRQTIVTPSTTAIVKVGGGTLSQVLEKKRSEAENWLKTTTGIKLRQKKGQQRYNDIDAYSDGKNDGQKADFNASKKPKLGAQNVFGNTNLAG